MTDSLSFLGQLSHEDKLLAGRVLDSVEASGEKYINKYTFFLDEHQKTLCQKVLASVCCDNYMFYGGYEGAQRTVLGIFEPYSEPVPDAFPLKAVCFSFRKEDILTHRDFLGCIMSLGVERDTVGDILVSEGSAVVFVYDTVYSDVSALERIGRVGVKTGGDLSSFSFPEQKYISAEGTVASMRIDSVLAVALRLSREKSAALIRSGAVQLNYVVLTGTDAGVSEGDIISAKGYGKFIVRSVGSATKKGRIHITVDKYI